MVTGPGVDTDVNVSTVGGMAPTTIDLAPARPADVLTVDTDLPDLEVCDVCGQDPHSTLAGTTAAGMALLVAPTVGRFQPVADAGLLGPGSVVGVVTGGAGRADEVRIPVAAEVCGFLAMQGQTVQAGQPLAWLRQVDAG